MVRRSRAEWLDVLKDFERSGESVHKFCARSGIARSTFAWWRWELGGARTKPRARDAVRLVTVDVAPPIVAQKGGAIRIELSDAVLHVDVGTDVAYVGALVGALRSRC